MSLTYERSQIFVNSDPGIKFYYFGQRANFSVNFGISKSNFTISSTIVLPKIYTVAGLYTITAFCNEANFSLILYGKFRRHFFIK